MVKVLNIQPDKFEEKNVHKFLMWNSKEQLLYINMPRSRTLSEGFMISMFGLSYCHHLHRLMKARQACMT